MVEEMGIYEFEEEIDEEEIDEEIKQIYRQRLAYKKTICDGVAWIIEEDGSFHLIEYKDRKKRSFSVELSTGSVRALKSWCDKYLNENEVMLTGYQ